MPTNNTIGAISVGKEERLSFSCIIRKIVCNYVVDEKTGKVVNVTFFDRDAMEKVMSERTDIPKEEYPNSGLLKGGISNDAEFYYITNFNGKKVLIDCQRETNLCRERNHNIFQVDYVDIGNNEVMSTVKDISEKELMLYYYDIFTHTTEYFKYGFSKGAEYGGKAGGAMGEVTGRTMDGLADIFINGDYSEHRGSGLGGKIGKPIGVVAGTVGGAAFGAIGGATVGNITDFLCSLRYFTLPIFKKDNKKDVCFTVLSYNECHNRISVPIITIYTYPDIEFKVKIGLYEIKKDHVLKTTKEDSIDKNKITLTPFDFVFTVKYAKTEKKIDIKRIVEVDEKKLDESEKEGASFVRVIDSIVNFFKSAMEFSKNLKELIEGAKDNDEEGLKKSFGGLQNMLYKHKGSNWIKGSLDIKPAISFKWHYSVSEDLSKLGRFVEFELGCDIKGELTIDLIEVAMILRKKIKKASTVAVATASVASGGLAALPAALIKFFAEIVVDWIIETFKKGVKVDLIFYGESNVKSGKLAVDTSKDKILNMIEGKGINCDCKIGIKFIAAFEYKTPKVMMTSVEVKASAATDFSFKFNLEPNIKKGYFGVDFKANIPQATIILEWKVSGRFGVFSMGTGNKNKKWETEERRLDTYRWNILKLYDAPQPQSQSDRN